MTYCEGALVDTVNFENLLENAPLMLGDNGAELDEIWVSKIVNQKQIRPPRNLCDAMGNLCMLFAATVGDNDVKLFKYHARLARKPPWTGQIVEMDFGAHTNFAWSQANFDKGYEVGWMAARAAWYKYNRGKYKIDRETVTQAQKHWASV